MSARSFGRLFSWARASGSSCSGVTESGSCGPGSRGGLAGASSRAAQARPLPGRSRPLLPDVRRRSAPGRRSGRARCPRRGRRSRARSPPRARSPSPERSLARSWPPERSPLAAAGRPRGPVAASVARGSCCPVTWRPPGGVAATAGRPIRRAIGAGSRTTRPRCAPVGVGPGARRTAASPRNSRPGSRRWRNASYQHRSDGEVRPLGRIRRHGGDCSSATCALTIGGPARTAPGPGTAPRVAAGCGPSRR